MLSNKPYYYNNFDVDVKSAGMMALVVGLCIGVFVGIIMALVCKTSAGRIVASLTKSGAVDEGSAKTIKELGLERMFYVKSSLKPDSALYKAIACVPGTLVEVKNPLVRFWHGLTKSPVPMKLDYASARFYIPEEKRIAVSLRFAEEKHPVRDAVLSVVLLAAVCLFILFALPELLTMLDNLLTQLTPESNIL